jgi:hypothetical protein
MRLEPEQTHKPLCTFVPESEKGQIRPIKVAGVNVWSYRKPTLGAACRNGGLSPIAVIA